MLDRLCEFSPMELLRLHSSVIEELHSRGIVRTKNNPVGDYTEWLVSRALGLTLTCNSAAGFDGTGTDGLRYQIKGRRLTQKSRSCFLSFIRRLEERQFDYLIAVIFDRSYDVQEAYLIPHSVVKEYANYNSHVNGHRLNLRGSILEDMRLQNVTDCIREVAS